MHFVYMVLGLAQIWAGSNEKRLILGKIAENKILENFYPYINFLVRLDYGKVLQVGHEETSQYLKRIVMW